MRRALLLLAAPPLLLASAAPAPPAEAPAAGARSYASASAIVEVTVREGTNMAAAPSPDGRLLAIDLLGRIWTVPSPGGEATPLTDALGDARQPTWSPDGGRIAFQAYWDGNYHVWSVAADGSDLRQHTFGPHDDREPHWSPDGSRIAFSSDRDGSYDVWELEWEGGSPRRLTGGEGDSSNEYAPAYAPDGRLAYVDDGGDGTRIVVREGDGSQTAVVTSTGDLHAPSWSGDGARIAYVELSGGAARLGVAPAAGEAAAGAADAPRVLSDVGEDVFPFRAAFTGDGRVLYTGEGRIRARPAAGGVAADVPFHATVELDRPEWRRRPRDLAAPGPHPVRGIVSPAVSPDGERVAFTALGDLWVMPVGGAPERLTDDARVETDVAWSPDGTALAYAGDRGGAMELRIRTLATGEDRQVTEGSQGVSMPAWSPDGERVAFVGGRGDLRVLDVRSGSVRTVREGLNGPGRPTWSPDGQTLAVSAFRPYSSRFREGVNQVLVVPAPTIALDDDAADGTDGDGGSAPVAAASQQGERWLDLVPHGSVGTRTTDGPVRSPDGLWIAYVSGGLLWAVPVFPDGEPAGPPRRLTNEIADDPTWAGDSESIVYLSSDRLRRVWLRDGRTRDIPVPLTWEREAPPPRVVVHAGRLFDGETDGYRDDVDVVVEGGRVTSVAPHDAARHAGAEVVDASGLTVLPGLVETHTHVGTGNGEAVGRLWLSWGITSVRLPAGDGYEVAELRESLESGRRPGPRVFGTGGTVDGSRIYYAGAAALSSTAMVDLELDRAGALAYDLIKTYVRLPDAVQARVIGAAHELGVPVTSHELYPAVAYGADGVEHVRGTSRRGYSPKVSALNRSYQDVVELLARSGMTLTPTVGIYGGFRVLAADRPAMFDDPRVDAFYPEARPGQVPSGSALEVQRRLVSDMSSTGKRVIDEGGRVIAGTDSPIIPMGLSLHAELEAYVRYGGMTPFEALRSATAWAGEALGYPGELGVVREGAFADLIVVRGDVLADVTRARDVETVVKGGRVLDASALLAAPGP